MKRRTTVYGWGGLADPQPPERNPVMALSDSTAHEIAKVLRKHVNQKTPAQIVNELLEIRGDKDFRDTVERLVQAIQMNPDR